MQMQQSPGNQRACSGPDDEIQHGVRCRATCEATKCSNQMESPAKELGQLVVRVGQLTSQVVDEDHRLLLGEKEDLDSLEPTRGSATKLKLAALLESSGKRCTSHVRG